MKLSADLVAFQRRLGHDFADPALLIRALTHGSLSSATRPDNQRLEFLGDRVLGLTIAEALLKADRGATEGQLAPRLNALVRGETCAEIAREIGLGEVMKLGRSEMMTGGRRKDALLGDAMEAVLAAVYLDAGWPAARALILRQIPNRSSADLAPFGLQLETLGFAGSYLSVSIDLPDTALQGLTRSHIIRLDITMTVERPMSIYGRLNIGHGPNTDQLLRHLGDLQPGQTTSFVTEFDMYKIEMNEKRLEKIWLDLIFEAPQMNAVRIRDLFLSRHLRADM